MWREGDATRIQLARSDAPWRLRDLTPQDAPTLAAVLAGMSPGSRFQRFHSAVNALSSGAERALLAVDGTRHLAVVAEVGTPSGGAPIGIGRYVQLGESSAEVAVEVVDVWHGKGVGTTLLEAVLARAHCNGVRHVTAQVVPGNAAALALARKLLTDVRVEVQSGVIQVSGGIRRTRDDGFTRLVVPHRAPVLAR